MKSLAFILLFYSTNAFSQIDTARTLGFAGVGSMNAESVGLNMMLNPAALSLNADLEFGAGYGDGELSLDLDRKGYYGWAKDSLSSAFQTRRNRAVRNSVASEQESFPFAAAFMFGDYKTDQKKYKSYKLSVSRVLTRRISLGGTVNYLDGRSFGQSLDKWQGDLGLVFRQSDKVYLGLSWLNLNSNDELEERLRAGGGFYFSKLLRFFVDVDYSLEDTEDELSFGGGFEAQIRKFFAFRSGYFVDSGDGEDHLGLGVSFMGPRLQLHYGVRIEMDSKAALHSVDFSLPLW
ncbi:MAG: hypothetical protein ACRBBP_01075 [Bdellovibrionales bacterium]